MKRQSPLVLILALLLVVLTGSLGGGGCARRGTQPSSPGSSRCG